MRPELEQLRREIASESHEAFLEKLRNTKTDIDADRSTPREWKRGNLYFHSLQDLRTTLAGIQILDELEKENPEFVVGLQACFVKDLDLYLGGFPQDQTEMKQMLEDIFVIGTSFEWRQDLQRVRDFEKVFEQIDNEVIRPWTHSAV